MPCQSTREITMPFGRFKGKLVSAVPRNYLTGDHLWDKLREPLKTVIRESLCQKGLGMGKFRLKDGIAVLSGMLPHAVQQVRGGDHRPGGGVRQTDDQGKSGITTPSHDPQLFLDRRRGGYGTVTVTGTVVALVLPALSTARTA